MTTKIITISIQEYLALPEPRIGGEVNYKKGWINFDTISQKGEKIIAVYQSWRYVILPTAQVCIEVTPEPLPPTVEPTYPLDLEVTTSERNSLIRHAIIMDKNLVASHTVRIFTAKEHAAITDHLANIDQHPPKTEGNLHTSIPTNTTGRWQVWYKNAYGWFLYASCETEQACQFFVLDGGVGMSIVAPIYQSTEIQDLQAALERRVVARQAMKTTLPIDDNGIVDYRHLWTSNIIARDINAFFQKVIDIVEENK